MAVVTIAFSDLYDWLDNQPDNTADTPYELNITGLTVTDIKTSSDEGSLGQTIKKNPTKYVDLSPTSIPDGVTDMSNTFYHCTSLVTAPVIPNGVTNMANTFAWCPLTTAPTIPNGVTDISGIFAQCTSLVNAPIIPNSVTNMEGAFYRCTSLTTAHIIPNGVTNMDVTFGECVALEHKPIIPSSVTTSVNCYYGVTTNNWKGTESQAESFLSTFFAQTTDSELQVYNNDRVTLENTIINIDISTLSTYLAELDPNTVNTAYKVYIRGLTSSNASNIKPALTANNTKYVDLEYTTIPQGTNCIQLFKDCSTLIVAPVISNGITNMNNTFMNCTSLVTSPAIPNSVTNMNGTFYKCSSLVNAPVISNSVLSMSDTFGDCTSLVTAPVIPNGVTNMEYTFDHCTSLVNAPVIPNSVTILNSTFYGCTSLVNAPVIPDSVTHMLYIFKGCTSLVNVPVIPDSVTDMRDTFYGCNSLRKIDEFNIPLNTLKNNSKFKDMFAGCTSLESIGFKVDTDKWHAWRLKFSGSSVEGKVFGIEQGQVVSTAIQNTQISQDDIKLPVLTDELWFPDSIMTDSEVEDVVEDVLNNRYTYWKKTVIDPSSKSLVMMASDPDNVVSNFLGNGEGIDVEVINNSKSITLNNDKRLIADGSGITVTLNYNSKVGAVTEIYAMQACTITYYTGQSTTQSWSMSAGTKAVFIYYSGWKLHSNYGTTNSVAVDNMQSVSSNAVAQALTGYQGKIKKYTTSISLTNSDLLNYGYKSKAISSDINNDNVVSIYFHTPTIAGSQGIQVTPVYCGSGNLYFTYIKPTAISETVTYTIEIYYI